jgi:MoaA/NifB/PqqE/SkfB family radical SAM enzyme
MTNFWQKFKLKYFVATKSVSYTQDYLEQVYEIYLNHKKVIHWRDGKPVYSLSTPALFSSPAANMLARQTFASIQNRTFPNLMSFAVNDDCNVSCAHCSFFDGVDDKSREILSLEQSKKLIADAQSLGVSVINIVGGEPLLREDLPAIIKSIDKKKSTVILFTNGLLLAEKIATLKKAGLDGVYVSIDSTNEEKHDKLRGKSGLFKAAIKGIEKAKKLGLSVGISTCITPQEFAKGEFKDRIEMAKKIGVHELLVFDAKPTGRFKHRKDLIDNPHWIDDMITQSKIYNKNSKYPGIFLYAYATSYKSTGCSGGTSYFYVTPYGDISPCDFNHATFGNILEKPLHKIWDNMNKKPEFNQATWNGCKMSDSSYNNNKNIARESKKDCSGCSGC